MVVVRIKREMAVAEVLSTRALLECSGAGCTVGLDLLTSKLAVAATQLHSA